MDRRVFLAISSGALAMAFATEAQQAGRVHRIGILSVEVVPGGFGDILRDRLRDLGYVEGRNVTIERRYTEGRSEGVADLALELARLKLDVIIATYPAAVFGARNATATIPIIMVNTPDPVELGLVASLARPGGNITGLTSLSVDLSMKQLELLREVVPSASRIAVLWNPDNPWHPVTVKGLEAVRPSLGMRLQILQVRRAKDFDTMFQVITPRNVPRLSWSLRTR